MTAPLYNIVHNLAQNIVNASTADDNQAGFEAYNVLKALCEKHEGGELDHPLQWEALGDFSESHEEALQAYQKGLICSLKLNLAEYSASIKYAMAEIYYEQENFSKAQQFAAEANTDAANIANMDLKTAISEFLSEIHNT